MHPSELSKNNRILIIDDNPAIHEDFRKILGVKTDTSAALDNMLEEVFGKETRKGIKIDFQIDSAYQGQDGLAMVEQSLVEKQPYAMAFVDMRMPPGWDGVETITQIWAKDASIQIVICTAYSDYSWQEIVSQLGNSDRLVILKKPFDSIEVLQLAHAMTKKWIVTQQAGQKFEDLNRLVQAQTQELLAGNERLTAEMAERELTRAALKNSEERLAKAFEACPLPIAILKLLDHSCVLLNQAFLNATGYEREQLLGHSPWGKGLLLPADTLTEVAQHLASGGTVIRRECQLQSEQGEIHPALIWIEPFQLESGPHLLAIVQDIADQEKLESQLRQAQKVEAIGHLAAGIAHDLNNLLTVILGHTGIQLAKPQLEPDLHASLNEVQDAGQRAASLTRQLLVFSRKQVIQKRAISLNTVIHNVEAMLRRLIPEDLILHFEHAADLPLIHADVCNLEQVIVNLMVNARDALAPGGKLSIRTSTVRLDAQNPPQHAEAREGHFVTLTVEDNGIGMDEPTLTHIFEPFFTTKPVGKGTGMGLSTVSGIVHQHDGWIEVSSTPGAGSSFCVYLPVTTTPQTTAAVALPTPPTGPLAKGERVILLVEDDDHVRALARTILRSLGYQVIEAQDGPQAIALWQAFEGTIHLLLTDMVMPGGLSGKDVAERFQADRPDSRVLYSSGYSVDLFDGDLNLREGFNYLPKPYFPAQLKEAVACALS
jgi:two-component system, cell cycle sensor histidine kinase and response regulator CckA